MQAIAVIAAKGGVGKTTMTANLAVALAEAGRPVLAVDLDPQNALRFHLATDRAACEVGLAEAAAGHRPWAQAMHTGRSGVVLLPFGSIDDEAQIALELALAQQPDWLGRTLEALRLPPQTVVVMDTPPGPTVYLQQALRIARRTIVTVLADAGSFATLPLIERLVDKYCTPRADFGGALCLVNQVDPGKRLNRDVMHALQARYGQRLLGLVHQDQAVSEALACAVDVRRHAPHSQAAADLAQCAARLGALLDQPPARTGPSTDTSWTPTPA